MKTGSYLSSLACIIYLGCISNLYTQDAPSLWSAPNLVEQRINKVPYSPIRLPINPTSTVYSADIQANQFVSIPLPACWPFVVISGISTIYYGGVFANGIYYACTYNPNNLVTINTTTGTVNVVGPLTGTTGFIPTSMAYKQPNGPMYIGAPNISLTGCNLYTVDLNTGICTIVSPMTNANGLMCMSVDCQNNCYGIDIVADNIIKINLTTGSVTIISTCGMNANYQQGMACDLSTGAFYWAAYSNHLEIRRFGGGLPDTVIIIPPGHELAAFGIQGTCGPAPACDMQAGPFVSLHPAFFQGTSYPIKAKITNVGTAAQTNIPVKFFVNHVQYGSTQNIAGLAPGAFDTNTIFNWTPTTNGSTVLQIATALSCDTGAYRANDTVTTTVTVGLGTIFCDDFTAGAGNWTITNNGGTCVWGVRPQRGYTMPPTATGNCFSADADLCGPSTTINSTATLTDALNCSNYTGVYCEFDNDFYLLGADQCKLDVSTDDGTTWINKFTWTTSHRNSHETQQLPEANGQSNLKIRLISIQPSWDWWWAVDNVCVMGFGTRVNNNSNIPTEYALKQNYPNPFNPTTVISYSLPKAGVVKLVVYDMLGREVKILVNGFKAAGNYDVTFDASGIASGLYFYRVTVRRFVDVKKMVFIK